MAKIPFLAVYGGLFSSHIYKEDMQTMQIHLKAGMYLLHGFYNPQKGHGSTDFPCGGHRAVQHGTLGTSWAHSGWVLGVKILGEEVNRTRLLHRRCQVLCVIALSVHLNAP